LAFLVRIRRLVDLLDETLVRLPAVLPFGMLLRSLLMPLLPRHHCLPCDDHTLSPTGQEGSGKRQASAARREPRYHTAFAMRTLREISMLAATARIVAPAALAALPFVIGCSSGSTAIPRPVPITSTTLIARLGSDTIAIERYTRTARKMEGLIVTRLPVTRIGRYSVDLDPAEAPTRADYSVRDGDGAALPGGMQSLSARFLRDSVVLVGHRTAGDTSSGFAVRGPVLPFVNNSYALYELALARMSATGRDSLVCAVVPLSMGTRQATLRGLRVIGPDLVRIDFGGNPLMLRHDGHGTILRVDGSRTTFKVSVERTTFDVDLEAIARVWKLKEQASAPAGQPSSRDTVQAVVGAAHLWIDYGRPALRGRDVWADGVLGDTLWRTGANAATQFRTDVDLVVGGKTIPAGTYTLWTATTGGYQLVVNKQTGQWGTVYDRKQDLVRVPLQESSVATPAERFTIAVEPQGTGGLLALTWGSKRLTVPVAPK